MSATAPKPDNFGKLGLSKHPPPRTSAFQIPEPPYWERKRLAGVFRSLISMVRTKASRGFRLEVVYRGGHRAGTRGTVIYFPVRPLAAFSRPFSRAGELYPARTHAESARKYIDEFLADWELRVGEETGSVPQGSYIYRLAVSLLFNKRLYQVPREQAYRAWRKGYLERRKAARKARATS